jgi:hypothetical protein
VASLLGEFAGGDGLALEAVESAEKRGGEAAGGAEPGAGRDIRHAGDFEVGMMINAD